MTSWPQAPSPDFSPGHPDGHPWRNGGVPRSPRGGTLQVAFRAGRLRRDVRLALGAQTGTARLTLPRPKQKIAVAVVYICGMLMNSLDSTIVNVALATLSRQFDVPPAAIEAVV